MTEPTPTYHVLDPNQPNPDKVIADAARAAYEVLFRIFVRDEVVGIIEHGVVFRLLRLITEQEIASHDAELAGLDIQIARLDGKINPQ